MKHVYVALAGLALLAGAPVTARSLPASPVTVDEISDRLDAAWSDLNMKWLNGTVSDREFQLVTDLLLKATEAAKATGNDPEAPTARYRVQAALDDLKARAANALKQAMYADSVGEQLIDFRLDRWLAHMKARAAEGKLSDEDFQTLTDLLTKRAQAAKEDIATAELVLSAIRKQADALLARVRAGNQLTRTEFQPIELNLAENRLYRRTSWLRQRALAAGRVATHFDYVVVSEATSERSKLASIAADVTAGYLAAIDTLEAAYGNDRITKEQFDKLMEQLKIRYLAAIGR